MGNRATDWMLRHAHRLIGIPEAALIAAILWAGHGVSLGLNATLATVAGPALTWTVLRMVAGDRLPDRRRAGRFLGTVLIWLMFIWAPAEGWADGELWRIHVVMALYLLLGLSALRAWRARLPAGALGESCRLLVMVLAAFALLYPMITPSLCGTGDGQWYATLLADMVRQVRAGVFPVFVGQSEYQFNGAINPLRLAPAFQYLGALLDAATLRALDPVALLNLLLVLAGAATGVVSYLCLAALLPARRWLACLVALLFLACPGVLALPYKNDLYLTWIAAPLVPLVLYGCLRSLRALDWGAIACLAGGTGLLWWAHSPVAIWMTAFVAFSQLVRWIARRPRRTELWREGAAAAVFLAVAAYPLVSVLVVKPEAGQPVASLSAGLSAARGAEYIQQVFPAVLLPLRDRSPSIEDLQLGYSLWLLWFGGLVAACWRRSAPSLFLALSSAALVLLLTPIPRLNSALWQAVPAPIIAVSGDYPMNRLYLLLGCFAALAGGLACQRLLERAPAGRFLIYPLLAVLCLWSGFEGWKLAADASAEWPPPPSGRRAMMPENAGLTRYSYLSFSGIPPYYTHGVTDPRLESRLLARDTRQFLAGDIESIEAGTADGIQVLGEGTFRGNPKDRPIFQYRPRLLLEPGRRYALILDAAHPEATGVLIPQGETLFRLYAFPEYGAARSFGMSPGHSHLLPLWTDQDHPEEIRLEFRTTGDWLKRDLSTLGTFRFLAYDPARLPVAVTSLIPYRARVTSPAEAWLETPRMYQDAYQAVVDGRRVEVSKSPAGLVMVPVPAGPSQVKVQYYPPFLLLASFWLSFLAALAVAGLALACLGRELRAGLAGDSRLAFGSSRS
jgi:hypothetical protein